MKVRTIELKDLGNGWRYKDVIELLLGHSMQNSPMIFSEVNKRVALLDELEKANGFLEMSESEYAFLFALALQFNWAKISESGILAKPALRSIKTFMSDLENSAKDDN